MLSHSDPKSQDKKKRGRTTFPHKAEYYSVKPLFTSDLHKREVSQWVIFGLLLIPGTMRQVPLECDINIAVNGCSRFATSTQKGPFMAMLISHSRGPYIKDVRKI